MICMCQLQETNLIAPTNRKHAHYIVAYVVNGGVSEAAGDAQNFHLRLWQCQHDRLGIVNPAVRVD